MRELPPGTAKLAAEAQNYFASRQLDKAEAKYLEVLALDEKNAPVLANLAAIQLELHHLDQAEKHITHAIALAPNEPSYHLNLAEVLRRQGRQEEAVVEFKRADDLDPEQKDVLVNRMRAFFTVMAKAAQAAEARTKENTGEDSAKSGASKKPSGKKLSKKKREKK